jgi:PBSX family phage terminase large subunit
MANTLMQDIDYVAATTAKDFHRSDKFIRTMIGPIGSGKSVSCCIEIFKQVCEQAESGGYRRSRWVIIRNTYRELIDTTMKTWFDWIPEDLGLLRKQDMEFNMEFALPDMTVVKAQILFRALDRPNDIKKLLSLELSGGWINEVREIPKAVLDMLIGRVGRYPGTKQGVTPGGKRWGVIMDTNPPDSDHWYYKLFEEIQNG